MNIAENISIVFLGIKILGEYYLVNGKFRVLFSDLLLKRLYMQNVRKMSIFKNKR